MKWTTLASACGLGLVLWLVLALLALAFLPRDAGAGEYKPNWFSSLRPFDGAGQDNPATSGDWQVQYQISFREDLYPVALNGVELFDIGMAYTLRSIGKTQEQSAPFLATHEPEVFLSRPITDSVGVSYGWLHSSTGEADEDSRSWDRQRVQADILLAAGDFLLDVHPIAWWAFDVADDNPELIDQGAAEGTLAWKGRFGVELWGVLHWGSDLRLPFEWRKNGLEVAVEVNTLSAMGKSFFTRIGYWNGKYIVLQDGDWLEAFTLGMGVDL